MLSWVKYIIEQNKGTLSIYFIVGFAWLLVSIGFITEYRTYELPKIFLFISYYFQVLFEGYREETSKYISREYFRKITELNVVLFALMLMLAV